MKYQLINYTLVVALTFSAFGCDEGDAPSQTAQSVKAEAVVKKIAPAPVVDEVITCL